MIFDVPKITEAVKNSLSADATSVIYNTDNNVFEYYDGTRWVIIGADVSQYTSESTGFPIGSNGEVDRTSSTISFDAGSREFTIAPASTSFKFLIKDKVFTKTTAQTTTISDTEGLHYIYFDETGSLTSATTFSIDIILKYVYVASIYWNAADNEVIHFGDERHGCVMDGATHLRIHQKDGAIFISGMALSSFSVDGDGSSASHAQFAIGSGAIRDEDIPHSLSAIGATTAIPVLYKSSTNWRKQTTANFKVYPDPTTGRLYYNNAGTLTAVTDNKFVLYHIVATNDVLNPFYSIMGSAEYGTKSDARVGAVEEIKSLSGLPFVEFVFVGTVIYQTNSLYTNAVKAKIVSTDTGANYVDWRFSSSGLNPTTVNLTSHNNLGGIQGGSGGDYYHSDQPINTTDSPTFANITTTSDVTAQGDAVVSGSLTVGGITFPIADGSAGQVIKTDGAGNLSFVNSAGTGTVLDTYITSETYTLNNSSTVTINTIFSSTDTGIYHFWTSGDPRIKGTVSVKSGDLGNSTLETVSSAVTGLQNNASTLNVYVSGSDIVFQNNTGSQVILVVRRETTPTSGGSSISDHNVLSNIQGGGSGNYYHSNQEINTTSSVTFGGLTLSGDIIVSGTAVDVDLIDNNASALSFDSPDKSGILEIVTTDGSEKVKMSGDLEVSGTFNQMPVGTIITSALQSAPSGFLLCDGSNTVSRTTYANLFSAIVPNKGTVTITIATPGVVTLNSHGFLTGESIYLTTTGALPTGLSADTLYFVVVNDANSFWLATSYANAIANTRITTSGSQSGTHTLFYCPYGLGSTTSNFKLPDQRNSVFRGRGLSTGFTSNGTTRMGYLEDDAMQGHIHQSVYGNYAPPFIYAGGAGYYGASAAMNTGSPLADSLGNGTPRTGNETRMKNQGVNFFIKF